MVALASKRVICSNKMTHEDEYHDNMVTMLELLGQEDTDHFVENWRAMVVVIDKDEMCQGYCRGHRPG